MAILAALAVQSALIIALFWEDRRRRRSEANAQVLMAELAHTNRVATAGQLTASIAHEIRQPLASIASFSSAGLNWLKRQPPNVEEVRSGLENIINQVHRVDDVIKSVNALFKNESHDANRGQSQRRLFNRFLLPRHGRLSPIELCWKRISPTTHPRM